MRKPVIFLLLLAGLLIVACGGSQPQITVETTAVDLGDVVNGEIITRDLTVKNEGEEMLLVDSVTTSCGCTQATLTPMRIAPGEAAKLHIEFDSGAHGPDLTGPLIRQVFILSNDPQQSEAVVELAANILPPNGH